MSRGPEEYRFRISIWRATVPLFVATGRRHHSLQRLGAARRADTAVQQWNAICKRLRVGAKSKLGNYDAKRSFTKTPESFGEVAKVKGASFAIQGHHGSLRARRGVPLSMPVAWADLPSVTAAGFNIHQRPQTADGWLYFQFQRITKAHLRGLALS